MATLPLADRVVAQAALEALYDEWMKSEEKGFTDVILDSASKVQFRPSTRQVVLTFDLAFGTPDEPT